MTLSLLCLILKNYCLFIWFHWQLLQDTPWHWVPNFWTFSSNLITQDPVTKVFIMLAATKSQDPKFLVEADAESKLCKIPTPQVLHKRHHKFCKKTINYTHPNFWWKQLPRHTVFDMLLLTSLTQGVRKKKLTVDNFEVLQWRSRPELFGPDVGIDAWKDGHLTPFWFTKTNVPTQPSPELKMASCSFPSSTETFMRDKVSEYWWTMVQIPSSSWSWTNRLSVCPVFEPKTGLPIWRNLFHFERESGSQKITFGNTGINEAKHILEVMSPPADEHFDNWLLGFLDIAQTHNRMLRCIRLPRLVAVIIFWYDK